MQSNHSSKIIDSTYGPIYKREIQDLNAQVYNGYMRIKELANENAELRKRLEILEKELEIRQLDPIYDI